MNRHSRQRKMEDRDDRRSRGFGNTHSVNDRLSDRQFGEITGELTIDDDDLYDKGMPVRSTYSFNKQVHDQNSHLDFDLYNRDKRSNIDIDYNDPSDTGFTSFCDINTSTEILSQKSKPLTGCLDGISKLNMFMYDNVKRFNTGIFNIDGIGLYMTFASLFYGSSGNSEVELKEYFEFMDVDTTYETLIRFIGKNVNHMFPHISFRSYIMCDSRIPILKRFRDFSEMVPIIKVNKQFVKSERTKINNVIREDTKCEGVMSHDTVKKIGFTVVNVMNITPVWDVVVDSLIERKFMGNPTTYLKFVTQKFGFYEDTEKILLEIPIKGKNLMFGIMSPKRQSHRIEDFDIDLRELENCIFDMKSCVIDTVLIPKIVKRTKIRLNSMLQNTGLTTVFAETDLPDVHNSAHGPPITDVIQYCDLKIGERCVRKSNTSGSQKEMRSLAVDKGFMYYIRYVKHNVFMAIGHVSS